MAPDQLFSRFSVFHVLKERGWGVVSILMLLEPVSIALPDLHGNVHRAARGDAGHLLWSAVPVLSSFSEDFQGGEFCSF